MCLEKNPPKELPKKLPKLLMDVPGLDKAIIKQVMNRVDEECRELTSNKFKSILKNTSPSDLKQFSWQKVLNEWNKKANTFIRFLKSASAIYTDVNDGEGKQTGSKKPLKAALHTKFCTMAMAGCTLLRARSKFMCAPMYRNALVLQHGGAKKRCYDRLNKIGVCVSRKRCLSKLKTISLSWDKHYLKWKKKTAGETAGGTDEENNEAPTTSDAPLSDQSLGPEHGPTPSNDNDYDKEEDIKLPIQITIDNLDRNVTPHTMTVTNQRIDHHWLIMVGSEERVSGDHLSAVRTRTVLDIDSGNIVPNEEDHDNLRREYKELVARVVVNQIPQLKEFKSNVIWHLPHEHADVMKQKSKITPLGLLDKDERKSAEMIQALHYINDRYVPYFPVEVQGETIMKPAVKIIVTGDQLTKQNADAAIRSRETARQEELKLNGLIPSIADWHCGMNFTDLMYKELYNTTSNEPGTMHQLRNLINRRNVTKSALGDNYRPCSDFLHDVTDATITAATLHHFGMESVEDTIKNEPLPEEASAKQEWFDQHIFTIVDTYIMNDGGILAGAEDTGEQPGTRPNIVCVFCDLPFQTQKKLSAHQKQTHPSLRVIEHDDGKAEEANINSDTVFNYHSGLLKLSLLERNFQDSVREGDGQRTCRLWKYKMLHFKKAGRHKYALEALKLQFDLQALLSPRDAYRVKWNRTVNTAGGEGKNIALDLNCEHQVRTSKDQLRHLGANVHFQVAQDISRTVGAQSGLMQAFEDDCGLDPESGKHTIANREEDISIMLKVLTERKVFSKTPGRVCYGFKNYQLNPLHRLAQDALWKWINERKIIAHHDDGREVEKQ